MAVSLLGRYQRPSAPRMTFGAGVGEGGVSTSEQENPWIPSVPGTGGLAGPGLSAIPGLPKFNPYAYQTNPYTPDYSSLIAGDWEVQFAEADMAARMARARADYRRQINQGLIDLGVTDASKLGNLGQYIDADTISQAANNKYSAMAKIQQEQVSTQAQTDATLAARGILSSGQTNKSTRDIVGAAEANRYSALRDYLSAGEQGLAGIADLESELGYRLAAARAAAAERAARMYPPTPARNPPGVFTPAGMDWPGRPTWQGGGYVEGTPTNLYQTQQIAPAGSRRTQRARNRAYEEWLRSGHAYMR